MVNSWLLRPTSPPPRPSPARGEGEPGEYFRETFPYSLPPLTRFESEAVPRPGAGHLDHGHDVPRRAAEPRTVHARADRGPVRPARAAGRPPRNDPPERVLPLHGEGPPGGGALPGEGPSVPGDHGLDPRVARRLPAGARGRPA